MHLHVTDTTPSTWDESKQQSCQQLSLRHLFWTPTTATATATDSGVEISVDEDGGWPVAKDLDIMAPTAMNDDGNGNGNSDRRTSYPYSSNNSFPSDCGPSSSSTTAASSSSRINNHDDNDEIDLLGSTPPDTHYNQDDDPLLDDPLRHDLTEPLSFKRKQKQGFFSQPSRLLTALTGGHTTSRRAPNAHHASSHNDHPYSPDHGVSSTRLEGIRPYPKDGAHPLDWYVEGPGRRVGYEDLTAIDWIFEYTKERQRQRVLQGSATGLVGYIRQSLDASQVWVILVLTGILVGTLAAGIDISTDWLADLKVGYCSNLDGGAFYLSRGFCCFGYDEFSKCRGWRHWSAALGITSAGGKWIIEYFFFLIFAVRFSLQCSSSI